MIGPAGAGTGAGQGAGPARPGLLRPTPADLQRLLRSQPIDALYELEAEPFASGQFACVRRCRLRSSGQRFAAKFSVRMRYGDDCTDELRSEVALLALCAPSPRIVRLHEVFETPRHLVMVLEYAPGGDLQAVLDDNMVPFEQDAVRFVRQTLEALVFLHKHSVAHLDIKPQNLVLTGEFPDGDVKLCDFEVSRRIEKGVELREILGTPDYVAPEILHYEPITLAADMWSLGVTTYALLTGFSPFGGETDQETFCNIAHAQLDFPEELFEDVSDDARAFIRQLLVREPTCRPSASECLRHAWLRRGPARTESSASLPGGGDGEGQQQQQHEGQQQRGRELRRFLSKSREALVERAKDSLRRGALLSQSQMSLSRSREKLYGLRSLSQSQDLQELLGRPGGPAPSLPSLLPSLWRLAPPPTPAASNPELPSIGPATPPAECNGTSPFRTSPGRDHTPVLSAIGSSGRETTPPPPPPVRTSPGRELTPALSAIGSSGRETTPPPPPPFRTSPSREATPALSPLGSPGQETAPLLFRPSPAREPTVAVSLIGSSGRETTPPPPFRTSSSREHTPALSQLGGLDRETTPPPPPQFRISPGREPTPVHPRLGNTDRETTPPPLSKPLPPKPREDPPPLSPAPKPATLTTWRETPPPTPATKPSLTARVPTPPSSPATKRLTRTPKVDAATGKEPTPPSSPAMKRLSRITGREAATTTPKQEGTVQTRGAVPPRTTAPTKTTASAVTRTATQATTARTATTGKTAALVSPSLLRRVTLTPKPVHELTPYCPPLDPEDTDHKPRVEEKQPLSPKPEEQQEKRGIEGDDEEEEEEPRYSVAQLISAFNKHQELASKNVKVVEEGASCLKGTHALRSFIDGNDKENSDAPLQKQLSSSRKISSDGKKEVVKPGEVNGKARPGSDGTDGCRRISYARSGSMSSEASLTPSSPCDAPWWGPPTFEKKQQQQQQQPAQQPLTPQQQRRKTSLPGKDGDRRAQQKPWLSPSPARHSYTHSRKTSFS